VKTFSIYLVALGQRFTHKEIPGLAREQRRVFITVQLGLVVISALVIAAVVVVRSFG